MIKSLQTSDKSNHQPKSVSQQISQKVILLSLITILGLASTTILSLVTILQQVQHNMAEASIQAVKKFDLFLLNIESDIVATAASLATSNDVNQVLRQMIARNASILDIFLINPDGMVLVQHSRVGRAKQTNIEENLWSKLSDLNNEVYISSVSFENGSPSIDMAFTVTDDIGLPTGILLAKIDLTELWNATIQIQVGNTGYVYITDESGHVIAYRNRRLSEEGKTLTTLLGYTPKEIAESQFNLYTGLNEEVVFASGHAFEVVPWFAIVEQPAREALAPFILPSVILVIVLMVVVLLVYNIIKFTQLRIVSPLRLLHEAVGQMAGGQLEQQINIEYNDEFGELAKSFATMRDAIKEKIVELNVYQDNLEQLVQQRTRRLEVSALLSKQLNALLNFNQLLVVLVNQIKTSFNYYYVQIYLLDSAEKNLVLAEGVGDAGREMKAQGYAIPLAAATSLVAQAARTGQIVSVADVRMVDNWLAHPLLPDTQAEIAVPIVREEKVVGVLDVQSDKIGGLDEGDVNLLHSLAGQVAVAMSNARLFAEEQHQRQLSDSLRKIAIVLNSSLERDTVLDQIMLQLDRVIGYDGAAVFLAQGHDLVIARTDGFADKFLGHRVSLVNTRSVIVQVYQTKQAISLLDVRADTRWEVWEDSPISSWMGAPLLQNETTFGLLALDSFKVGSYGEAEAQILQAFANQAALAIQNARLYGELAKLNADKDKFFSIVAHDLRGPFMPLLGNSDLLMEVVEDLSPLQIKQMAVDINRSAKNVFNLLENLLSWSRLQRGRMDYQPETVELHEITEDNVELLKANAQSKSISLRSHVPKGIFVYADRNMVNTVIRNLTSNALKFTPQGGQVIVSAEVLDSQVVQVQVADSGLGMSEEVKQKLFKIDQNVTTLGTAKEKGTGLGLIICQEMVEKSGGCIWVESEVGRGTTVKFTVRLERVARPESGEFVAVEKAAEVVMVAEIPLLTAPSVEQLGQYYEFAMVGNMMAVEQAAKAMAMNDETLRPFAMQLIELARNFEDEDLVDLLQKYMA